jgi:hypothetical protein
MQAAALTWCVQAAGERRHRGLDGAAPLAVFTAGEAGALTQLPKAPFTLAVWTRGKVGPDIHVKVGRALHNGWLNVDAAGAARPSGLGGVVAGAEVLGSLPAVDRVSEPGDRVRAGAMAWPHHASGAGSRDAVNAGQPMMSARGWLAFGDRGL